MGGRSKSTSIKWRGFCVKERGGGADKVISNFFQTRAAADEFLLLVNKLKPPKAGAERFVSDGGGKRLE